MPLSLILFIIYTSLFLWMVPRCGFVRRAGESVLTQRGLIAFKILFGFAGAAYLGSIPNSDNITFNKEMDVQYRILIHEPFAYFDEIIYQFKRFGTGNLFAASESFWGYIRYHLVYMFTAPMNLITGGNFYLNAAVFSSFTYFGHLFFLKIFNQIYPGNKWAVICGCFFIPSLLLFSSCVHKDGLVFTAVAVLSYILYRWFTNNKISSWKYIVAGVISFGVIFLLRNYVVMALIPSVTVAIIYHRRQKSKMLIAAGFYGVFVLLFFITGMFNKFNLPQAVVNRKHDFAIIEKGNSNIAMNELQPNAISFIKNTPQALSHVLLRPHPLDGMGLASMLAGLELYLYLLLILLAIWQKRKKPGEIHSFNIYGFFFFLTMALIIGLTIPNLGAIVRYRSILWIFILPPVLKHALKVFSPGVNHQL